MEPHERDQISKEVLKHVHSAALKLATDSSSKWDKAWELAKSFPVLVLIVLFIWRFPDINSLIQKGYENNAVELRKVAEIQHQAAEARLSELRRELDLVRSHLDREMTRNNELVRQLLEQAEENRERLTHTQRRVENIARQQQENGHGPPVHVPTPLRSPSEP